MFHHFKSVKEEQERGLTLTYLLRYEVRFLSWISQVSTIMILKYVSRSSMALMKTRSDLYIR